ncbi:AraC family transcriptional regulator [Paenibacillus qinlingensis]|uniref:AraC family transcriptional regulator n=1 Tax=Paenibacillus qinlingensis TaxID=1837343 RepID=UPI0015656EE6|nr:AraC family transcriptional regulator [Paenibacillus qinlingensis]
MRYFTLEQNMSPDFPFNLTVKNKSQLLQVGLHAHDYFQICYVQMGSCIHVVENQKATLVKGDLFSIPPHYEHDFELFADKDIELVHIDFMPYLLDSSLLGLSDMESFVKFAFIHPFVQLNDSLLPKLNLSFQGQQIIEALIREMQTEWQGRQEGFALIIKSLIQKLLVVAGREYAAFMAHREDKRHVQANRSHFDRAIAFIEMNYHRDIKLSDAAAEATMAVNYFSTMFKLLTGRSFVEYVTDLRLNEALRLLLETSESMEQIAFRAGFNHMTHFYRVFKKKTGITPSQYRKMKHISLS